jgi:hypothetical protein
MGWAQRVSSRAHGRNQALTGSMCAQIADRLRAGLKQLGVTVHPDASIGRMIADAEWLGAFRDGDVCASFNNGIDQRRFATAFLRMEQARRIAELLERCQRVENSDAKLKPWIRKRVDRLETQSETSQDYLFELDIAARLAAWPHLSITMSEPDIQIRMGDDPDPCWRSMM